MLRLHPERADNWIADDGETNNYAVRAIRERLEDNLEISNLPKLIGKDGKPRPREYQASFSDPL